MKRKNIDELNTIVSEIYGSEREQVKEMLISAFTRLVDRKDDGSGFPIWGESKAKLMELAYAFSQWRIFIHHPTGTPATMREIAEMLCEALHCDVPHNIYDPVFRMRKRGRCVIDYYAKLWREGHVSPEASFLWARPIQFPKIHDYVAAFDSPYFRAVHMNRRRGKRQRTNKN